MMENNFYKDKEMQSYFETLPALIKESIMQSGTELSSLNELKSFVNGITQPNR